MNAEEEFFELNISVTGARSGDILLGRQKCTMDVRMKLCKGEIHPQRDHLDELRENGVYWKLFLRKLSDIAFFAKMSVEERELWLKENQRDEEFINDNCEIELLDAGKEKIVSLLQI